MKPLMLSLALASAALAQQWPAFRGPMASGVNDAATPPLQWNAEKNENVAWKTPIPGLSVSSPVMWNDRVFVVTSISSNPNPDFRHGLYGDVAPAKDVSSQTWKVFAVDRNSGKIVWDRVAHEGAPKNKRHPKSSFSSPSPVTDGKHVVAWFGSEGLYCWDWNGKLLWKKDLGVVDAGWFFDPDFEWGVASSPVIWRNLLIVQSDQHKGSFLAAFDVATGKPVWKVERDEIPGWSTPAVFEFGGKPLLVTNSVKRIRGHDPLTGKQLWELGPNSEITVTTPVTGAGLIFVANGYPPIQPIYAIRPTASGDITLKENAESSDHIAWSKTRGGPYMPTPLFYQGLLYICSNRGVLNAYDAKTGERVYEERIAGKGGAFSASPIAANGHLFLTSEDGEVHVAKAGAKYEHVASNAMGEVLMATPAIAGDWIIVRGMKHLYGIRRGAAPPGGGQGF